MLNKKGKRQDHQIIERQLLRQTCRKTDRKTVRIQSDKVNFFLPFFFFLNIFLTELIGGCANTQRTKIINFQPLAISFVIIKQYF